VSVTPTISKALGTNTDFDAVWTIKNTGSKEWNMYGVDYKYMSGTQMHKFASIYDFNKHVKPGDSIKITVDMMSPSGRGVYTANWAIVEGSTTLCNLPVSIAVK
jgi:hypothetical protein